nr:flagellin lysine-N-methylase [Clostridia bacterium]
MSELFKTEYLVPDYYPKFVCKCGECRHVCCHGWDVALPMNEYYRLLGLECTPEIRRKLDTAMRMVDNPRPERYAVFAKGWDGGCPLHDEDGLCMLQKNMGEEVLPWICRLYPRRHSERYGFECSCSGGCENTLELMFASDEKLGFVHRELEFEPADEKAPDELIAKYYTPVRRLCIERMQDRDIPLSQRVIGLCSFVGVISEAVKAKDSDTLDRLLAGDFGCPDSAVCGDDISTALDVIELIVTHFIRISPNLAEYGDAALEAVGLDGEGITDEIIAKYRKLSAEFAVHYPKHELYFEHILVNHIFHEGYPFSDQFTDMRHGNIALCSLYALLRFICVCCTNDESGMDGLVDIMSAVLRMAESSPFGVRAAILLNKSGMDDAHSVNSMVVSL